MRLQVFDHACRVICVPASHIPLQSATALSCRFGCGRSDGLCGSSAGGAAPEGRRWFRDIGLPSGDPGAAPDADDPPMLVSASDGPVPRLVTITRTSSRMGRSSHARNGQKRQCNKTGSWALKRLATCVQRTNFMPPERISACGDRAAKVRKVLIRFNRMRRKLRNPKPAQILPRHCLSSKCCNPQARALVR